MVFCFAAGVLKCNFESIDCEDKLNHTEGEKLNLKNYRDTILIGIVTSLVGSVVFLYLLDPIIGWIYKTISSIGVGYIVGFLDSIYKSVAMGARDYSYQIVFSTHLLIIAVIVCCNLFVISVSFFNNKLKKDPTALELWIKKISEISTWKTICSIVLVSLLFVFPAFKSITADTFAALIIREFEHRIVIISPYASDQEIKLIRSQFARINGRADYKEIMKRVEKIAAEHDLKLPSREQYINSLIH